MHIFIFILTVQTLFISTVYSQSESQTETKKTKTDNSDYQENYEGNLAKESEKYEQMFRDDMNRLAALGTLTKFIKKFEAKDEARVSDLEEFFRKSSPEERTALVREIEKIKDIQTGEATGSTPFEFGKLSDIEAANELGEEVQIISFYSSKRRLINYLSFLLFCTENNLDAKETFRNRGDLFHNGGLRIGLIPFARQSDVIKVSSWKHIIYDDIIKKFREGIDEKLQKASDNFNEVKASLFVDEEVLQDESIKILFLVNSCSWSKDSIKLKDIKKMVSFEDYALMHMKVFPQYLEGEAELSIGYIHGAVYGYNPTLYSKDEFMAYLKPMRSFSNLENEIYYSSDSIRKNCANETMSGVLEYLKTAGIEYDYVFFFTDGFGDYDFDRKAVTTHFPNTRFIFKALNPEAGSFSSYQAAVARPGKDIVLNTEYYSPRYKEYFDRKSAMMTFERMIAEIDKL